ncbi:hypothetical protein Tco_0023104, partial [Tanacetum coccineum]
EALAAAAVTHAASTQEETNLRSNSSQIKSCTYKEFRAVMQGNFRAMFIWKYYPRNEVKQMENELWNLKEKTLVTSRNGTETTTTTATPTTLEISIRTNAHKQQECSQSDKVCMLENYHYTGNVVDTTLTHVLLLATTVEGQGIKPKNAELHLVLQAKEEPESKEDWVLMLPASDAVKRSITRTSVQTMETKSVVIKFEVISTNLKTIKSKETLKETTKLQPATKEEAKHSAECTICVQKLLYRTT